MAKHYFLTRSKEFVECEIVKETSHKRQIRILEGKRKGKITSVHPDGVSNGKLFPRIFKSNEKPDNFFVFKGRVLMAHKERSATVPEIDNNYRFQPWLSHVIDNINSGENTLLTGGMGCGKTSAIVQLAARINQPVIRINFNAETRLSDLIGKMQVRNGETIWQDGVLPEAIRNGSWLILDELDCGSPEILSLLNPVLEQNPSLVLKENGGESVKFHPAFRVFATANSIGSMQEKAGSYAGTNQMNSAFLDRWCVLTVPNIPAKEEVKLIKSKVRGIKNRWAKRIVEFAEKVRKNESQINLNDGAFSTRLTLAWSKRTALLGDPIEAAKVAWLNKITQSEHENVLAILETCFGNNKRNIKNNDGLVFKKKKGRPKKENEVVNA